jgi:indole-3-glycerol phosphate synthase
VNILDEIIAHKIKEVADAKARAPLDVLVRSEYFLRTPVSMSGAIQAKDATGIIAEFKRRSPSKGVLNQSAAIGQTTAGYAAAGASALSVLTDSKFFGGSSEDLIAARRANKCPIIRKDFVIDEYQIVEAKSIGADAILLIAAVLATSDAIKLARFAHSLKLEVLLEVHDQEELARTSEVEADMIGVNNRNLKSFEVSIDTSKQLAPLIRDGVVKVSESGISDPTVIHSLRQFGYEGFLIGESFMKSSQPEDAARIFIKSLREHGTAAA